MAFFSLYFVCFDWRMLKTVWACVEWYSAINHKFSLSGQSIGSKREGKNTFFNAVSRRKWPVWVYISCFDWRMLKTVWACVEWYSAINHKFSLSGQSIGSKRKEKTLFLMHFHAENGLFQFIFVCFDWRMLKTVWACVEWYSAINHKFSLSGQSIGEQKGRKKHFF